MTLALLVRARRQHQGWFDDNDTAISNLLVEKNCLHKTYFTRPTDDDNNSAFYRSRRLAQQRLREMQDAWMARKAEEMQRYADLNEWKNFFSAIKAVYGPPTEATEPLHNDDDSILFTEKTPILRPWTAVRASFEFGLKFSTFDLFPFLRFMSIGRSEGPCVLGNGIVISSSWIYTELRQHFFRTTILLRITSLPTAPRDFPNPRTAESFAICFISLVSLNSPFYIYV
nr:unnamed protein product [Spirometra erinaceieuropaei]